MAALRASGVDESQGDPFRGQRCDDGARGRGERSSNARSTACRRPTVWTSTPCWRWVACLGDGARLADAGARAGTGPWPVDCARLASASRAFALLGRRACACRTTSPTAGGRKPLDALCPGSGWRSSRAPIWTNDEALAAARAAVDRGAATAVVTRGAAGALAVVGERVLRRRADPVEVIDTLGAGDALIAGFISATIAGARTVDEALDSGARAAAERLYSRRRLEAPGGPDYEPANAARRHSGGESDAAATGKELFARAARHLAGGVGSGTRARRAPAGSPYPIFVRVGERRRASPTSTATSTSTTPRAGAADPRPPPAGRHRRRDRVIERARLDVRPGPRPRGRGGRGGRPRACPRWSCCASATPAPSAASTRSVSRAPSPGASKMVRFEGHYHGWSDVIHWSAHPPLEPAGPVGAAVGARLDGHAGGARRHLIVLPWNDPERARARLCARAATRSPP